MAGRRFNTPLVPTGEVANYTANPFNNSSSLGLSGLSSATVRPNDDLLLQKGGAQAFSVYQKLMFDDTVQSAFNKMLQEITSRDWKLHAASESRSDVAVKDFVQLALKNLQVDEIYRGLLEAYVVGFSVGEVMWRRTAEGVIPFDFRFRDQRRFRFEESEDSDYGFSLKLATRNEPLDGVEVPARKFIPFRYWSQNNGDPYGAGLARILYPIVKFKRRALEAEILYSDRFANPTAVAKAPLSATSAEVDTLYDHLSNLSQETALVLPEGFDLEFVSPGGSADSFKDLRTSLNKKITTLIAGEDEAGSADAGSRASSEVAQTVRQARAKDLSELVSHTLNNSLIRWIVDLNFGTDVAAPRIYRDFQPKEQVQLSMKDVAVLVNDVGIRPTTDWISSRFDVALEADDEQ